VKGDPCICDPHGIGGHPFGQVVRDQQGRARGHGGEGAGGDPRRALKAREPWHGIAGESVFGFRAGVIALHDCLRQQGVVNFRRCRLHREQFPPQQGVHIVRNRYHSVFVFPLGLDPNTAHAHCRTWHRPRTAGGTYRATGTRVKRTNRAPYRNPVPTLDEPCECQAAS
jgi:hypothetical protein